MLNVDSHNCKDNNSIIKKELCIHIFWVLLDPDEIFVYATHTKELFS